MQISIELFVIVRLEYRNVEQGADVDGREVHLRGQVEQEVENLDADAEALLDLIGEVVLDRVLEIDKRFLDGQEERLDRLDDRRDQVVDEVRDVAERFAHVARKV